MIKFKVTVSYIRDRNWYDWFAIELWAPNDVVACDVARNMINDSALTLYATEVVEIK